MAISIPPDDKGYIGRECPKCEHYFKIKPGTGVTTGDPPCNCPYCGHCDPQDQFFTTAQIEYAKSVAINKITGAVIKDLKSLEFNHRPKGAFGIGISMKVEGRPQPVRRYSEKDLEEEILCDNCGLEYTIYGCFAFCPDCARHNSLQILDKNIDLAIKMLDLAGDVEEPLSSQLINDALENGVSAFDGFGRETCRVHSGKANDPTKAENVSFQNLKRAQQRVVTLFGVDVSSGLDAHRWAELYVSFQKRHLLAHTMGVVDDSYIRDTGDQTAVIGRKISISPADVRAMLDDLSRLGKHLASELAKLP